MMNLFDVLYGPQPRAVDIHLETVASDFIRVPSVWFVGVDKLTNTGHAV